MSQTENIEKADCPVYGSSGKLSRVSVDQTDEAKTVQKYLEKPSCKHRSDWPAEHNSTTPYSDKQPYAPIASAIAMTTGKKDIWGMEPTEEKKDAHEEGNGAGYDE
ncbi:Uu.00g141920.m01.CDS01 [Anthostomella pinea]|uniref:Uu.00g141920.m01.CDS01 n=1 Tax=Anthostomella pinea TaxID=933095 RepID=A0AAI8YJ46_9PEZI|nr:Uu.00g141920.m01.CDS01 [Anthostomella pinea]